MYRILIVISILFSILCQYHSFKYNLSLKENERKKLSTKESIKSVIKPNGITASITTKKAIKIQSNVCNSTLVYPEYAHSTHCYPQLYLLIFI